MYRGKGCHYPNTYVPDCRGRIVIYNKDLLPELVKTEALTYMDEPSKLLISGYAFLSSAMVRVAIPPSSWNQ